jgi:hypothetical protein
MAGWGTKLSLGDIEGIGAGEVGDGLGELRLAGGAVLQLGGPCQNRGEGCKIRLLDSFILNVLGGILEGVSGLACLLDFQHDGDEGLEEMFVEPMMNAWSRSSTWAVIRVAASQSARTMMKFPTRIISNWRRVARRRLIHSWMETRTSPAMCPRFSVPGA